MKKWAVVLYNVGISGGANVIFEHALYAYAQNTKITIISKEKRSAKEADWHIGTENFQYKTFEECDDDEFDVAIATAWETAYSVFGLRAKKYIYFVQSIESFFFENKSSLRMKFADLTYDLPFGYITEATWIAQFLMQEHCQKAELVLNGIDKNIFSANGEHIEERKEGKLRILVEGQLGNWLKNVSRTIELCRRSDADEIWLMTSGKATFCEGVDRVFSQVPLKDVAKIYRSCDVLVKLSLVEGMFGPPLEMFHCGGTAITYNINGSEEYIRHGINALVAEVGNEEQVIDYINKLKHDPGLLKKLKKSALKTAENWRSWEAASETFYNKVEQFPDVNEELIRKKGNRFKEIFDYMEAKSGTEPSKKRVEYIIKEADNAHLDIVLYGAGAVARGIISQFDEYGISIEGIAVTSLSNNPKVLSGNKVSLITDFLKYKEKYLICIATNRHYEEIAEKLKEYGFRYV